MAVPIIPVVALLVLISVLIYRFVVAPLFLSPLSRIPNAHWSCSISPAWILFTRRRGPENATIHAAHEKQGPIVRLGPNEVSINCIDGGIRTVYAGGFEKGDWYHNLFKNFGVEPMFAMPEKGPHSQRKRMLSNIYAKSVLQSSKSLAAISNILLRERLLPRLRSAAAAGRAIETYDVFSAVTMDFVNAYIYGLAQGSNFIQDEVHCAKFLRDYKARQTFSFWPQEVPNFLGFISRIGLKQLLVPDWVDKANKEIESWTLSMCDSAEAMLNAGEIQQDDQDYPHVYAQLRDTMLKHTAKLDLEKSVHDIVRAQRLEVASEMLDHLAAGFDTSGITLTYLAWELSRPHNKAWQDRLRLELRSAGTEPSPKDIESLPVLQAILMETLRLHTAIPGGQPRITPSSATLGPKGYEVNNLPAGVRVHAQAYSLHRNHAAFPDPEMWNPDRWLSSSEVQMKEMGRWFWAFGSGGRMCVGSNLAIQEMKAIITAIWSNFDSSVVDDKGMVHNGGYLAGPIGSEEGNYLVLELKEVQN